MRDAIGRLDLITQRTAAAAEENASASTELSAQVEDMFRYIETLEAMVSEKAVPARAQSSLIPVDAKANGEDAAESVTIEVVTADGRKNDSER